MAHGGDGAHEGHDGGHAHAGQATHEALSIATIGSHGESHVSLAHHGGHDSHDHGQQAISPSHDGGDCPSGQVPLIDKNGEAIRGFRCQIAKHGNLDILTHLYRLARKYELLSPHGLRPGLDSSSSFFPLILDCDAFRHALELTASKQHGEMQVHHGECDKPEGWYPNATGHTTLYTGYWQVSRRKHLFAAPQLDDKAGTYIRVSLVTWSFYESGDFETSFEVRVISIPEWSPTAQQWGYRKKPFESHQRVAIKLCTEIMQLLRAAKPSPAVLRLRSAIDAKYGSPAEMPPTGTEALTQDDVLKREEELIAEDARDDQVARDNQPGLPAASDGDSATAELTLELDDW